MRWYEHLASILAGVILAVLFILYMSLISNSIYRIHNANILIIFGIYMLLCSAVPAVINVFVFELKNVYSIDLTKHASIATIASTILIIAIGVIGLLFNRQFFYQFFVLYIVYGLAILMFYLLLKYAYRSLLIGRVICILVILINVAFSIILLI